MYRQTKEIVPGLLVCAAISAVAFFLHSLPFWPFTMSGGHHPFESMTIAILIGMMTNHKIASTPRYTKGVNFGSEHLLYAAIVFLGAKLNLSMILHLSWKIVCIVVICIVFSYFITMLIGKKMKVSEKMSSLVAFGTAICGGSAIAAISPMIKAKKKETVIAIAAINFFGTVAIFVFPIAGHFIHMTATHFAIWAGTSIQAVPQVVASCFTYNNQSGVLGTTVKLVRVLFLAPMLFILLKSIKKNNPEKPVELPWYKAVPPFIVLFFAVVVVFSISFGHANSINDFMLEEKNRLSNLSDYLMILAMAAIGMQVSFSDLSKPAIKPILLAAISFVILASFSFLLIWLFKA